MSTYKGKKIAIIGISIEGIDAIKYFASIGVRVDCLDRRSEESLRESIQSVKQLGNIDAFHLGDTYLQNLSSYDCIVRTPGMLLRAKELDTARENGCQITSVTKLLLDTCPAPIIGITGTKGKGTTSTLIASILRENGMKVYLGGNVGMPLLSKVHEMKSDDWVVLEMSSFQLEDVHKSPHISVVLRVTQDHLQNTDPHATNFHESREAYVQAKTPIVRFQTKNDFAILCKDDKTSASFSALSAGTISYYSRHEKAEAYVQDDTSVILRENVEDKKICLSDEIHLRGAHNLENIAAAVLAATTAGVKLNVIIRSVKKFKPLEHRLETVRTVGGVTYYNDSFSTVPEPTIAALQSFHEPIVLIVGGTDKGSDFTVLAREAAKRHMRGIIVIGTTTDKIVSALKKAGYSGTLKTGLKTMHEIIVYASKLARKGDVVVLSPACASFDMFQNYKQRGTLFKHEVSLLKI
jgi:UDP-N-acetylmuramoylalanine--D-glutamate ligase